MKKTDDTKRVEMGEIIFRNSDHVRFVSILDEFGRIEGVRWVSAWYTPEVWRTWS